MCFLVAISEASRLHRALSCGCVCKASRPLKVAPCCSASTNLISSHECVFLPKAIWRDVQVRHSLDVILLAERDLSAALVTLECMDIGTSMSVGAALEHAPVVELVDALNNFSPFLRLRVADSVKIVDMTAHKTKNPTRGVPPMEATRLCRSSHRPRGAVVLP